MSLLDKFHAAFAQHLENSARWTAFCYIIERLDALQRPVTIVETGCAREPGNWAGDGQSTLIWDWVISEVGGTATSYDISPRSVAAARSQVKNAEIIEADSVIALRGIALEGRGEGVDLLYLDSYDWGGGGPQGGDGVHASPTHHLAELASIYSNLRSGCIIAVDDCFGPNEGKHVFVARFLKSLGVEPVASSYITVWIKS